MLFIATNVPCEPVALRIATESVRAFVKSGPTWSSGRSQSASWCSRGIKSVCPGKRGLRSRKAIERSSSKTTCASESPDAIAQKTQSGSGSGNDRERARVDSELELGVVADVVAV